MMSSHAGSPATLRENDRVREESDASFNWSPDYVTKRQATGSTRQGYSIITGLPVTQAKRQAVFTRDVTDPVQGSSHGNQTLATTWPSSVVSVSKAPFLNMRQQRISRDRTLVNSCGFPHAPSSGFYSTTVGERSGTGERSDLCRYSRHPSSGALCIGHGSGGSSGCGEVHPHSQRQRHNAVESLLPG